MKEEQNIRRTEGAEERSDEGEKERDWCRRNNYYAKPCCFCGAMGAKSKQRQTERQRQV